MTATSTIPLSAILNGVAINSISHRTGNVCVRNEGVDTVSALTSDGSTSRRLCSLGRPGRRALDNMPVGGADVFGSLVLCSIRVATDE
ncbi:hypothetical protein A5656_11530 [Mycobacterium gordonae]|nr:hypothetical protein A5656_11530 [Mycobacterium gordonae]